MKLNCQGLLIVLSGPSGVGKGTVREALFRKPGHHLKYSISMTTRNPRAGEVEGVDYYFVTREQFEAEIARDNFLEYAEFVGNLYGTPLDKVQAMLDAGDEVVLEIETDGASQVRAKLPNAVFIFISPPSIEVLRQRLENRATESEAMIQERVAKAKREIPLASQYDYIVINDDVDKAADRIMAIIRAEHSKRERTLDSYKLIVKEEELS